MDPVIPDRDTTSSAMIDAKEISAAEIILMEGHEETFIEDETMRTKIRYLSRGYIREVYIDLARRRPTA